MTNSRSALAKQFRELHVPGTPVVVGNAWDAASAAALAAAGFAAIATTSGGVAWTNGVPDGNRISREAMLRSVDQMLAVLDLPLSVDIEAGLSVEPSDVAALAGELAKREVAGLNLEDSWDGALLPISSQCERLAAVRKSSGPMFLNARVDTFLIGVGDDRAKVKEASVRAAAFVDAGADGIFVPGVADFDQIRELVSRINVPLNIMTGPGGPTVLALADSGVARVSLGTALAEAAYSRAYDLALQLRDSVSVPATHPTLSYPILNGLLTR